MTSFLGHCSEAINTENGLIFSLFLVGLIGGATHCAGMCGPFVLAQTAHLDSSPSTSHPLLQRLKSTALIPYHLGRMTTYVFLAVIFSSLVNVAFLYSPAKAVLSALMLVTAAFIFIVNVFPVLQQAFPWLMRIHLPIPVKLIQHVFAKISKKTGWLSRYALGLLLGFLPCGMVVAALMASSTASSTLLAAVSMGFFALGTVPSLWLISFGGDILKKKYPSAVRPAFIVLTTLSSIILLGMAGSLIL